MKRLETRPDLCYRQPMPKSQSEKSKKTLPTNDDFFDRLAEASESPGDGSTWIDTDYSGQLAVDVYQTNSDIVIRAAIAGVSADNIDITVNNDMVTIKGIRQLDDTVPAQDYLYQECYWGGFSRTIILPVEVDANRVSAKLKNGILNVTLPKIETPAAPPITVVEDDDDR